MADNDNNSLTKVLVDISKWSGKTSFGFFVVALITTMILISIAEPTVTHYVATGEDQTVSSFTLDNNDDVQLFFATDNGETRMNYTLIKITYLGSDNIERDFRQSSADIEVSTTIFSVRDSATLRQESLAAGSYKIVVSAEEDVGYTIGVAQFELALVALAAVFWVIFSIAVSIFFTILPFTIFVLILNAVSGSSTPRTPPQSPQTQYAVQQQRSANFTAAPQSKPMRTSSYIKGTPFEALTKNDWIGVIAAVIFFIAFLAEPSGPFGFIALIIAAIIFYSVTEREKNKDRIQVLLQRYNQTSIKFLADQLDKKEDYVIEVLRLMILDDGLPIRMDLINGSVTKIGEFPELNLRYGSDAPGPIVQDQSKQQTPTPQAPTSQEQIVEQHVEEADEAPETPVEPDFGKVEKTKQGEVRDYASYCSSCGEGLLKETKYCYSCGARQ